MPLLDVNHPVFIAIVVLLAIARSWLSRIIGTMSKRPKDLEAYERKLRPIYDALDSRNWKGALKLCQQALQKYPDDGLVKVLKAIGLDRSGKRDEANQTVDEVVATTPTDDQVLRLASMVLRGSGRPADITRMYEAAAAAASGQQALVLLHEVFGAHVRECNFVKQQQVALRLSKAASTALAAIAGGAHSSGVTGERYGWWVVMSLVLQARAALRARAAGAAAPAGQVPAVAMEPEKLLALAEGMVARQAAKDGRLEGYEALMVYVDVLLAQGKVSEALSLVSGPLGASALRLPSERLQLRAVLAALAGQLGTAAEALRESLALPGGADDWGALLLLLDCLLPGTAEGVKRDATPALFAPRHPLILISGGLAEQLPPKGMEVPTDGGASEEAFCQAEAVIKELIALGAEQSATASGNDSGSGNGSSGSQAAEGGQTGNGGSGKAMIMRGPDLALVDLAMRRHRAALAAATSQSPDAVTDTEAAVVDAVVSYFQKYGSLVSCAVDLRTYVAQLSDAAAERLTGALQAEVDAAAAGGVDASNSSGKSSSSSAALSLLRRRVCAAQIRDDCGLPSLGRTEEGVQLSRELLELYGTARPLQEGLDERERGAADELPVLAAAALATSATLAPSDAAAVPFLLAAYCALSDAVRHRPFGAGMRISLTALATLLAAPAAAAGHLYKLDIKHIQLDSLGGHLLLPPLLAWPCGEAAGQQSASAASASSSSAATANVSLSKALKDTRALFEDHGRDAGETLFTAYNHGMYTKILEFNAFRERLAAAHTLAVVRAEGALTESLQGARTGGGAAAGSSGGSGGAEGAAADALRSAGAAAATAVARMGDMPAEGSLRFNWDLSTRPTWLPPCAASPSLQPLEWWRSRAKGETKGQGYGRCWWSATSAAEASHPAAAAWRASLTSATAHRWLLPHCIAGAAAAGEGTGAAAPAGAAAAAGERSSAQLIGLKDAVERLRALVPPEAATGGGEKVEGMLLQGSVEVRRLDVALYEAILAVQECLAPVTPSAASGSASATTASNTATIDAVAATSAAAALSTLTAAARALTSTAAAELVAAAEAAKAWGGVVPGGAVCALSHLLREPLVVLVACLQTWQASLRSLRKRRTKAGAQLEEGAVALGDALTAAVAELAAAVRSADDALVAAAAAEGAGEPAIAAAQAVRYLEAQGHGPACLSDTATSALEVLIREQRATLAALAVQAAALRAALT